MGWLRERVPLRVPRPAAEQPGQGPSCRRGRSWWTGGCSATLTPVSPVCFRMPPRALTAHCPVLLLRRQAWARLRRRKPGLCSLGGERL